MLAGCCRTFILNRERAVDYLNMLERLYIFDGFAGWDPEVRCNPLPCYALLLSKSCAVWAGP